MKTRKGIEKQRAPSSVCLATLLALLITITALAVSACGHTNAAAIPSPTSTTVLGADASGNAGDQHGLVWKFKTGAAVRSELAVADGVVYVGGDDGYLYAVDGATGRERWRFKTGEEVYWRTSTYPPLVADRVVYAGSDDGCLWALDTGSGRERWQFKTGGKILSSPAVAEGMVYVGSTDGCLYAIDGATGEQRWKFKTGGKEAQASAADAAGQQYQIADAGVGQAAEETQRALAARGHSLAGDAAAEAERPSVEIRSSPAVAKGLVYVGSMDGHLYALDSASGKQRWKFKPVAVLGCDSMRLWRPSPAEVRRLPGEPISDSPVVFGRLVYVNDGLGVLHALDSATGRWRWSYETGGGTTLVSGGVLYQAGLALDPTSGKKLWRFERSGGPGGHPPVIVDGLAYFGWHCGYGCCGTLVVVDRKSGHEEWTFGEEQGVPIDPDKPVRFSPAVVDDVVYFANQDGHLHALDRKSGEEQWSFKPDLTVSCSPTVSRGVVYFGSYDGCVYAVK